MKYNIFAVIGVCFLTSCQTHLARSVSVLDSKSKAIDAKVVFETSDWNYFLLTLDNGIAVTHSSSNHPVTVMIPNHKEVVVTVIPHDNRHPSFNRKIRYEGEGNLTTDIKFGECPNFYRFLLQKPYMINSTNY